MDKYKGLKNPGVTCGAHSIHFPKCSRVGGDDDNRQLLDKEPPLAVSSRLALSRNLKGFTYEF